MPEGHTLRRLADDLTDAFGGRRVSASSPQGRFAQEAALLDGSLLERGDAAGKHLFLTFSADRVVHVHLGLIGRFDVRPGSPPAPVGQIRLRLAAPDDRDGTAAYADLRGATRCALVTPEEADAVRARLGPDPLRADADPDRAWRRIRRSDRAIGDLLMDQAVIAGIGNVFRAEVLFRQGIHPLRPGRAVRRSQFQAIWGDLAVLMAQGVRSNRIDTVRRDHTPEAMGRPPRQDDHGGEVYVYRRQGQPCHVCGSRIATETLAGRNAFWCPALPAEVPAPDRPQALGSGAMAGNAWDSARRWWGQRDRGWLAALYGLVAAGAVLLALEPASTGIVLMLPLLLATLFLSPKRAIWFAVVVLAVLAGETIYSYGLDLPARRVFSFAFAMAMCLVVIVVARRRATIGVARVRTDSILEDLRRRLSRQGVVPALPSEWYADVALRAAGGTSFAGDFLVTRKSVSEDRLDLAVVDVSGKGVEAGPKSLLLSGAFAALISALSPPAFLARANDFVIDQDWSEGFATAIYLSLNLRTGEFRLWSAGHPPAVHFRSGSGHWKAYEGAEGPALGLVPGAGYEMVTGQMQRGDALLLFTDGLIEKSQRDVSTGLDTLLGEGERLLKGGFERTAQPLVDKLGSAADDCALVVLHRRGD